jgi:DNA helicase II / ATP-dependent DNA helicase PcrA
MRVPAAAVPVRFHGKPSRQPPAPSIRRPITFGLYGASMDPGDNRLEASVPTPFLGSALSSVLGGLTAAQHEVVTAEARPLCVMAGAGSGKTRVLTRRVARRVIDGSADPERTLVLTFTRKAAEELKARLAHLGVDGVKAGTFHAIAFAQLRRHWADTGRRLPAVVDGPDRIVRKLLSRSGREVRLASAVSNEISWARARMVGPEGYSQAAAVAGRSGPDRSLIAGIYADYNTYKTKRRLVDLDDLVVTCADLLERDPDFRAAQHFLHRHFFVDELQDLNAAQWRLLRGWIGGGTDLFVVGDPLQAVYSWNGAEPGYLTSIEKILPGVTVMHLGDNHRCARPVVDVALAALGPLGAGSPIRSAREEDSGRVQVNGFESDTDEALAVAQWLRDSHIPGTSWSSLAVLARTNARLDPVEEALSRAGIPVSRKRFSREAQQDAAGTLLRAMPLDTPVRRALALLAAESADLDLDIESLAAEIDNLCLEVPEADIGELLSSRTAGGDPRREGGSGVQDAVQLATFHRSKGLEWNAVAVVGLEDGTVPISYAVTREALDEERRLVYVALTRAENELFCSWAGRRTISGREFACDPSPYLDAITVAARKTASVSVDPRPVGQRIAALRDVLSSAS